MGCGLTIHLSVSDQPHLSQPDSSRGPIVAREWLLAGSLGVNGSNPFTLCMLGIFVCVLSPVGSVLKPTFSKIFSGSLVSNDLGRRNGLSIRFDCPKQCFSYRLSIYMYVYRISFPPSKY